MRGPPLELPSGGEIGPMSGIPLSATEISSILSDVDINFDLLLSACPYSPKAALLGPDKLS
jgi:hypothetical protein